MILVDDALQELERRARPIRVGLVGAGFMGRGIALQLLTAVRGIRLAAIANRTLEHAELAFRQAGVASIRTAETVEELEGAIDAGHPAVAVDAEALCLARNLDVILEVTGTVEFAARVILRAIENGKHVVIMNAEVDGTVGPILKVYADRAGVVFTNSDGDQPGVIMNLYRFVKGIGVRPVLCGNIKGLHDPYRNPTTQAEFARRWGQSPYMVTSFADGSKVSFEQAIVANATGMRVAKRGMLGPTVPPGTPVDRCIEAFPEDLLLEGPGIVDYLVGASPSPGVFVLGTHDHPVQRRFLDLYKLGAGPLYCFYRPYHLCHFEAHHSIARAFIFRDATITPLAPCVDVVATAKVGLKAEQVLDRMGGYMTYGLCENVDVARGERLLPLGLAEGCRLVHDVSRDHVLTYDDVEPPEGRISDRLRREQEEYFAERTIKSVR